MGFLTWFWGIAAALGILYSIVISSATIPAIFTSVGWGMLLVWVLIAEIYRQKFLDTDKLIKKARKENVEFADGLVRTLNSQIEEIKRLKEEREFLMISLEQKGIKNDGKN
jgi:hypothetical protein